jgi:hypothetical protein
LELYEKSRLEEHKMKKFRYIYGILIVVLLALAACGQQEAAPASEVVVEESGVTDAGGLDAVTRLALGTLKLEGTGNAVSVEQADELLPLWKVLESGTLKGEAENAAIVKQIEDKMAAEQLAAIDGMGLTFEDTRVWMQEQGIAMGAPGTGQGAQSGQAPGALQNLSEEERTKMRTEMQNMTAEQRATRMAEMGIERSEGQEGGGMGVRPAGGAGRQANVLLGPVVELLTERSAG